MNRVLSMLLLGLIFASAGCQTSTKQDPNAAAEPVAENENAIEIPKVPAPDRPWNVALLIMDGTFNTELTAPMDIFHHTKFRGENHLKVFTVAKTTAPITTFEELTIVPDYGYLTDSIPPIDVLVVPSAEHHLDSDLQDTALIQFVQQAGQEAQYVTSHCDGAFILAKAGLLDGVECTTFPGDIDAFKKMFPELTVHSNTLFVHHGKVITSAGGAKSFEAALYLHHLLFGKEATEKTAEGMVIDWDLSSVNYVYVADE